jgi:hypothetical protein
MMRAIKQASWLFVASLFAAPTIASAQSISWSLSSPANESLSYFFVPTEPGRHSAMDADGNLLLVGSAGAPPGNRDNIVVRKVRPDGTWAWSAIRLAPASGRATATGIAVDANGDVLVSGLEGAGLAAFLTVKFDGETGGQLWERVATAQLPFTAAAAIAVDANEDVIVAGTESVSLPGEFHTDFLIVKYQGDSGQELWRAKYVGVGLSANVAAVAIDASGDTVLSGYIVAASGEEFVTAKLDGVTGQQLWARVLPGSVGGSNRPAGLALDGSGDVIVTGWTRPSGGTANVATIKYSGSDGTTLWDRRYDGAVPGDDFATGVAVDERGNVSVVGRTDSEGTGQDFLTLHYGNDGTLLWSRTFNASGTSNEMAQAVSLDAHGNVFVTGGALGAVNDWDFTVVGYAVETGRMQMRVQHDFGDMVSEESSELKWSTDGSLLVAGVVHAADGPNIGVMKIIVPLFADAFEAEAE